MENTELARQLFLQALDHQSAGHLDLAEEALRQAHALLPDRVSILVNLSALLIERKHHTEAAPLCAKAVTLDSENPLVWLNHGICQRVLGHQQDATEALARGHQLAPEHPAIRLEQGLLEMDKGNPELALEHTRYVLKLIPDSAEAHHLCGNALSALGLETEAIQHFSRALELDPDSSTSAFNRGLAYLMQGDYLRGFQDYESRWKAWKEVHGYESLPQWDLDISPRGKRILIHAEQGYGDSLQFCRFIPMLCDLGAHVTVGVPPELRELFSSLRDVKRVVSKHLDAQDFDLQCPLASLPYAFHVSQSSLPCEFPYLNACHADIIPTAIRNNGPLIGLAWTGSDPNDNRSIPFELIEPLLHSGHQFVCLQKDLPTPIQGRLTRYANVFDASPHLNDFSATAAVMKTLDKVVSIDTAIAHLAGALAMPGYILLPHVTDWRWREYHGTNPWYPSLRAISQPHRGDWASVIQTILQELTNN